MVTADVELELRFQLKEAGRLLSNPPASIDELLHILDQLEKLLSMVDQSPDSIMQETLSHPMKALVDRSLLEHSNMDVKVSVAACLSEITRITAPDAPYSDEEMKGIFECIVSSLENLSDSTSRSYAKRVSILETVSKVRACVIMLDLECDDLIVKLFDQFLNSVRDHHLGSVYLLMVNIMTLVLEESEEISLDLLKRLLESIRNNSEGILSMAKKLGEEVIKKAADKLRPFLNKALTTLGSSLLEYSAVLTSICNGTNESIEHNDESVSAQPMVVDTAPTTISQDDAVQVISHGELVTANKDDTNKSVAEKSEILESKADKLPESARSDVSEPVYGDNSAEKGPELTAPVQEPLQTEVTNAPSQKESLGKIQIKKGIRSKKKSSSSSQTDQPSTVAVLTKVNEALSDPEMRSPKRARKKTPKAEENKPSATTVSDVESQKNSGPKQAKRSAKKVGDGGSAAKKPKLSGKKVSELKKSKEDDKKVVEAGDSDVKSPKRPLKKVIEIDSSDAKTPQQSGKKGQKRKVINMPSEDEARKGKEAVSNAKKLKQSGKKEQKRKVIKKPSEDAGNREEETDSDATPLKESVNRGKKSNMITKPSEDSANDNEETDSEATPLKQSVKKGNKSNANKDEEIDSDNKPLKLSENKEEETGSDHEALNLSENKDDEETDSDNIPLMQSAKRVNKNSSSVVKSSSKNKDYKKQGRGKNVKEKEQTKSLFEDDDGMDVSLKSVLQKASKGKGNLEEALSTGAKRKRSVTKDKVTESIKFDDSLVGQKVKVWWALDKMYYEGVVASFDSKEKKHKVTYVDGDEEILNLRKEKWEIVKEFSTPNKKVAVEAQNADILPEIAEGESKVMSKEAVEPKEEKKKDDKKGKPQKIVYSRGKKGSKSKTKSADDDVKEFVAGDAAEVQAESEKEKSTKTPKTGSKSGQKKKKMK
ncbi:hypothetical protein QVD17_04215 [Tagetes erecta]|uniref:Uncharacterized protein n=1 Tax=Tagetes erecta TaxID=13708 RepID=A0AAD8PAI9_TARER|nr:hypothetical protein QVD17_04215 [Tagetes erecta]